MVHGYKNKYNVAESWILKIKFQGSQRCLASSSHSKTKSKFKKKLMTEKLSKSGLRRCKKFGHAHSDENDERKITLSLILHFILDFKI